MDRKPINEALELVKNIVMTHGIMSHMPQYNRDLLARTSALGDQLEFCFNLDPTRSAWDTNNFSCSLKFCYVPKPAKSGADGGAYCTYDRRISFTTGGASCELYLMKSRENMMSALILLAETLDGATPESVTVTVESPGDAAERRQREHEQRVGGQIYAELEKTSLKNLRTGGKPRLVRFTATNDQPVGSYRYEHVRRYSRRGRVVETVNYRFVVTSDSLVKVYRTA